MRVERDPDSCVEKLYKIYLQDEIWWCPEYMLRSHISWVLDTDLSKLPDEDREAVDGMLISLLLMGIEI